MDFAKAALVEEFHRRAAELGVDAHDLLGHPVATQEPAATRRRGGKRGSGTGAKVAPKYRDIATGATWSGRGREPTWLRGKNREDFAIGAD